jgi:hypothetical protein
MFADDALSCLRAGGVGGYFGARRDRAQPRPVQQLSQSQRPSGTMVLRRPAGKIPPPRTPSTDARPAAPAQLPARPGAKSHRPPDGVPYPRATSLDDVPKAGSIMMPYDTYRLYQFQRAKSPEAAVPTSKRPGWRPPRHRWSVTSRGPGEPSGGHPRAATRDLPRPADSGPPADLPAPDGRPRRTAPVLAVRGGTDGERCGWRQPFPDQQGTRNQPRWQPAEHCRRQGSGGRSAGRLVTRSVATGASGRGRAGRGRVPGRRPRRAP